jgi:hypothetical protein
VVELDGDRATGVQHYVFIDQQTHDMRLAWARDRRSPPTPVTVALAADLGGVLHRRQGAARPRSRVDVASSRPRGYTRVA